MELTEAKKSGAVVLGVNGRVDATNAGVLEQRVLGLIDAGEKRLVIDCAELQYISSAGLRVLLVAAKRLSTGGQLALAALNHQIRDVFDIAGFSSIFQIYPTQADAVAALQ
ncbi:MAG TPA: STAS domain-containing protein [Candidatus Margulisiibacteriota bacterium]|nr:STAS domain-containing protein [Candidatus Margulisiibacteriota bacterium]